MSPHSGASVLAMPRIPFKPSSPASPSSRHARSPQPSSSAVTQSSGSSSSPNLASSSSPSPSSASSPAAPPFSGAWLTPPHPRSAFPVPSRSHTPGLHNLGNTCYLNSALQCLLHLPPLAALLLHPAPHRNVNSAANNSNSRHHRFCSYCALRALASSFHNPNSSAPVSPSAFARNTRALCSTFRPGRQEDAHEFVRGLLDAMTRAEISGCGSSAVPSWHRELSADVHRIFGGALQSRILCSSCNHASLVSEPFLDLSLEIPNQASVERALARFTRTETLSGDNRYRCDSCRNLVVAQKRFSVRRAPNVLTLHIKRFDRARKDSRFVSFSPQLDLSEYMIGKPSSDRAIYELTGVLVHQGQSRQYGHYFAYVKSSNGSWYLKDDSTSRTVPLSTVLKQKAYVLFYCRTKDFPSPSSRLTTPGSNSQNPAQRLGQTKPPVGKSTKISPSKFQSASSSSPAKSTPHRTTSAISPPKASAARNCTKVPQNSADGKSAPATPKRVDKMAVVDDNMKNSPPRKASKESTAPPFTSMGSLPPIPRKSQSPTQIQSTGNMRANSDVSSAGVTPASGGKRLIPTSADPSKPDENMLELSEESSDEEDSRQLRRLEKKSTANDTPPPAMRAASSPAATAGSPSRRGFSSAEDPRSEHSAVLPTVARKVLGPFGRRLNSWEGVARSPDRDSLDTNPDQLLTEEAGSSNGVGANANENPPTVRTILIGGGNSVRRAVRRAFGVQSPEQTERKRRIPDAGTTPVATPRSSTEALQNQAPHRESRELLVKVPKLARVGKKTTTQKNDGAKTDSPASSCTSPPHVSQKSPITRAAQEHLRLEKKADVTEITEPVTNARSPTIKPDARTTSAPSTANTSSPSLTPARPGTSQIFRSEGVDQWEGVSDSPAEARPKSFSRSRINKRRRANDEADAEYDRGKQKKVKSRFSASGAASRNAFNHAAQNQRGCNGST